jgi:hypothetical protein
MFKSLTRASGIMMILAAFLVIVGCSGGGGNPVVPSDQNNDKYQGKQIYESEKSLGEFSLSLDSTNMTGNIEPVNRESAINVTQYVNISILGLYWDPVARIWDIDVQITNPTPYSAFGPWIVFTETGEQKILDQDGFIWWVSEPGQLPERIPVIAFAKQNPQRIFYAMSSEFVHLRIHWPDGWEGFNPINFFIDVSFPQPRQHPIIENLQIQPTPIPEMFQLTAFVKDWQLPPPGPVNLEVGVDLSPIGLPPEQMFDDGMHGDGAPGDDIWGCQFMGIAPPPQPIPLTVHAWDWEGYHFENDVIFGAGPGPECLPMEFLDAGEFGLYNPIEMVIRDPETWETMWRQLHQDMTPPPVDFTREQVVWIDLGERPSSGYFVNIDCVQEIGSPFGLLQTVVDYTENIPGPDCNVLWVMTSPYQIVKTPLTVPNDMFNHNSVVYNCGGDCQPIRPVAEGDFSMIHEPFEKMIMNENDWVNFWMSHNPQEPPPPVDWAVEQVIALGLGDRPTGGFWIRVDCVQFLDEPGAGRVVLVKYTEMIPGPDCPVPDIITQPFNFVAIPRFDEARADYIHNEEVYDCIEPCLPIKPIQEGNWSLIHEPREMYIRDIHEWNMFWQEHGENTPAPDVDWENEEVIVLMLGERRTDGYWISVDCVSFKSDPGAPPHILVEYTEMIPGQNCPTNDVITYPYNFFAIPKQYEAEFAGFVKNEMVYDCPPECLPIRQLAEGMHSNIHQPVEKFFNEIYPWHQFWMEHRTDPTMPPPPVDFTAEDVIALILGDRPTTGYWIRVDCVRFMGGEPGMPGWVEVEYTEMIPGPDCIVQDIITQPFFFFAIPKASTNVVEYIKHEEVYNCQEPPDCQPMETIGQGPHSGVLDPYNAIFYNMDQWHQFWMWHAPGTAPPQIDFTRNMIVVTCLGERPTTGYEVNIDCIRFLEDPASGMKNIEVTYSEWVPGQSCIEQPVITSPFHFVVVPMFEGEQLWNGLVTLYECRD